MRMRSLLGLIVVVPLAGCPLLQGILGQDISLPLDLTSPPQDFDVGAAVTSAEGSACTTSDSPSCNALTAICQTDAARDCTTPSMPDEFPASITVPPATTAVDAQQLMVDMGISKATELKVGLPVDVGSALQGKGVDTSNPDAIKSVTIQNVVMVWSANTLTFDAPPLDLYLSKPGSDVPAGGTVDAAALIASGDVVKVGSIGIDLDGDGVFDIGQAAGSTDDVPVTFVAGGNDLFNTAVKSAKFTVVTAVPDGKGMKLKVKDGDATKVLKPNGAGTVAIKATLVYKISAADIVSAAQGAGE